MTMESLKCRKLCRMMQWTEVMQVSYKKNLIKDQTTAR